MSSKGSARSYLPIVRNGDILPPVAVTVTATVFPKSPNHIPGLTVLVPAPFVSCECSARVRHALTNFGVNRRKIEVEIKPDDPTADLRGARWAGVDLPVAVAILSAETPGAATDSEILWFGELSLDGAVRPVLGAATVAKLPPCKVVVSEWDAELSAVAAPQHTVFAVSDIMGASRVLTHRIDPYVAPITPANPSNLPMADVVGLDDAKESVIGAVSQRENILLLGPSGCGRTMLAELVTSIMPPLEFGDVRRRAEIISVAGLPPENRALRPFRRPHHTCSAAALVGGSPTQTVGEVQLASGGVLMLDEVAQFARSTIDSLASRLRSMEFPPMVILADSPCLCGWPAECKCAPEAIARHLARIEYACQQLSVNTRVDMPLVDRNELATLACQPRESSAEIRERIAQAWKE